MYLDIKKGNIVGKGIYGEGQLLSVGDDLFFIGLQLTARLKLQFQNGTPLFNSMDPPLWYVPYAYVYTVRVPYAYGTKYAYGIEQL